MQLWQLYDDQGRAIQGKGATKNEIFLQGRLHGASHVWIWRKRNAVAEVLLQKRAATKQTWPGRYDISAAGHIDLGEDPLVAALREIKEEIGVNVPEDSLRSVGIHRTYLVAENGAIENEFQWLYLLELRDSIDFNLQTSEVALLEWKALDIFKSETTVDNKQYVPHGRLYYETIVSVIEAELAKQ